MKHILSNPHNGAPVSHEGVKLAPGQQLHVRKEVGESLMQRFPFLMLHLVNGDDKGVQKAKPVKINGVLNWKPANAAEANMTTGAHVPVPDHVEHVAAAPKNKAAAKKKVAKKK